MDSEIRALLDERAIARLAADYARAVDRLDENLLRRVFTADAVLEGPGWRFDGIAQICGIIPMMQDMFVSSWHATHQQTIDFGPVSHDGGRDEATGEVYCAGRHLQKGGYAENQVVTMIIRYQDRYVREPDGWRIAWRKEIIDWTEVGTVQGGRRE
jgi:ketosteroid isomerase-like protein